MHGEVGRAVEQGRLELLDEQALAADLGQRTVEDLVAARGHAQQLDAAGRIERAAEGLRTCSACHRARRDSRVAMTMRCG
jgi:mono/diheme cytochrome c family protein